MSDHIQVIKFDITTALCSIFSIAYFFSVPSSKRSKVVNGEFDDDDDIWNDDVGQLKRPVSVLGAQKRKSGSPVKDVMEAPASPDRHLMERILQHRNKHNVRELQMDPQAERHQRLVNGKLLNIKTSNSMVFQN